MSEIEASSREILASCEKQLVEWIRREATRLPFGTITVQLKIEVQKHKPVMLRVSGPAEIEEKFR